MLFNSYHFIFLFLPVTLFVYFLLNRKRLTVASKGWLLLASLLFYGWWNVRYLPLILVSILFNYSMAYLVAEQPAGKRALPRKPLFLFGVAGNLAFLCYFKYMDFFLANLNALFGTDLPLMRIVLPLGISFFTITQIAFLVDCYEGLVEERDLLSYSLFVTFFPHLLAGPVLHHKEMMPQFDAVRNKVPNYRNLSHGLFLFFIGLFKKVVIADTLATTVKAGFDSAASLNLLEAWVASLAYTLQLYFDFSGYSDMAIGAGLLFNIVLPVNFNSPYKASSIIDFWQRWHMSLTSFITTYVYAPMLRSCRNATFGRYLSATFLTMVIAGIWHGAGWTFVLWGAFHGAALVVNHLWKSRKLPMPRPLGWVLTFLFVNCTFVLFRARNLADAEKVLKGMFRVGGGGGLGTTTLSAIGGSGGTILAMVLILALTLTLKNSSELREDFRPSWRAFLFVGGAGLVALVNMDQVSEFLYFQF